ncbi:BamA/TamA family outer membrane protein [Chitinophaga horti]|uniref:BamA/TamA family outer membrane protein n=1 Tax=Chitinophaga horti TaxID=2920382 RepID=A0ABY6J132_9BACT|nr:BamA/TamA family outer membrane protein [Chitinophaga horti]UYQ93366.1 BamA/TamA family outer membrane protein [Chitinophaga horti]
MQAFRRLAALVAIAIMTQQAVKAQDVLQRIILIGDAGELHQGKNAVIDAVRQRIDLNKGNNTILFLGDNIYPKGLPSEAAKTYPAAKAIIDYQIGLVRGTTANGYIIPGNHDWKKQGPGGWETVRNQQRYIDSQYLPNVQFFPKDGCPGPVGVPIGNSILLIMMDSEWWLHQYEKPGLTSSCDCKNEDEVTTAITDLILRNPGKLVVFATHHPFRSYGPHGGYYTLKQHIFPFTDLNRSLYIPLPVIGSIYPITRGVFGTPEDIPHPQYQRMIKSVEAAIPADQPTVFVSGHDHTLQFIRDKRFPYIVSGAGAKDNRVRKGKGSEFATCENGYTVLEMLADSTLRVNFYNDESATPLFTTTVMKLTSQKLQQTAPVSGKKIGDTVVVAIDPAYNKAGVIHRKLLGDNYRAEWAQPMSFPVMDLQREKGGLKILQRGGGKQTSSLRLEDSAGNEWVLRSLRKNPIVAVPVPLRETFAVDLVQDQISGANPYAPLVVAPLATAAGIPHANPKLVYLPKDTSLGIYRNDFGDQVYLFEEREPGSEKKTYNTEKMLEKLHGDNDNEVDQHAALQARLLDMLMADWDRHDDQWRWGMAKEKKGRYSFYPVPRDRDQAFYVNEGVITRMLSWRFLLPFVQGFREKIPYIQGFNFNPRYFDRSFLNELDESDWHKQTQKFVATMNDEVLKNAVGYFPDSIEHLPATARTYDVLKARRAILEEQALKHYRFISKGVDVTGSEKHELFQVERLDDGKVKVKVSKIAKSGDVEQTLYKRTFDPKVTKEIRLFSLGGKDRFELYGDHRSPIRIRMIGGKDADTYIDSTNGHFGKRVQIYDLNNGSDSFNMAHRNARLRLSSDPAIIEYNRKAFLYDKVVPLVFAAYNLDDGISLGAGVQYTNHGFRKLPFKSKQTLTFSHAIATQAYNFHYNGHFTDVIGRTDLLVDGRARAPHNTINFFGLGNDTKFDKEVTEKPIQYYRTRFNYYTADVLLSTKLGNKINVAYGPTVNVYSFDRQDNDDRYINNFDDNKLDSFSINQHKYHAGGKLRLEIDTRNNTLIPSRGIHWTTTLTGNVGLNDFSRNYSQLKSDLSLYLSFREPANFVVVTRFGAGHTWGSYEYFQALSLGSNSNLRGFRNNRFAGRTMAYNNTEFRLKLFQFSTRVLPATVGLIGFNDVGRVWVPDEKSSSWHDGYGGGFYLSPINMFIITAELAHSKEGLLPYFSLGFKF